MCWGGHNGISVTCRSLCTVRRCCASQGLEEPHLIGTDVHICDQMKLLLLLCNAQNVVLSIEVDACSK